MQTITNTSEMELVTLHGSAVDKGYQHGELLKDKIHGFADAWRKNLWQSWGLELNSYLEYFYRTTRFEDAIGLHAPYILDEIKAISRAANIPYHVLFAIQHINEEFWLAPRISEHPSPQSDNRCSTVVSCADDSPTLVCHNLDLPAWFDGHQMLMLFQGEVTDTQILGTSVPGQLLLNGMNNHGVAVADNALLQLNPSTRGLPVFAIYRIVLEQRSFDSAIQLLHRVDHASGINWAIGGPGGAAMFEASASKVVRYQHYDQHTRLFHTNHPLVNRDQAEHWQRRRRQLSGSQARPDPSSHLRFASLEQRLADPDTPITVALAKDALSARDDPQYPVSVEDVNNDGKLVGLTLTSSIFDVSENPPKLHISSGPPHRLPHREIILSG